MPPLQSQRFNTNCSAMLRKPVQWCQWILLQSHSPCRYHYKTSAPLKWPPKAAHIPVWNYTSYHPAETSIALGSTSGINTLSIPAQTRFLTDLSTSTKQSPLPQIHTEAAASPDSSCLSRIKMQVCTRQSGDGEMLPHQAKDLCNELGRCFQAPSRSVWGSTAPCLAASVCKESLCWFCAGMPRTSCSRAPVELINHFQKASRIDKLGFGLCSLENDLAWSLRFHIAMGGGWQSPVVMLLVPSHSTSFVKCLQTSVAEEGACTGAALLPGLQRIAGPRSLHMLLSLWWVWQPSCHTRHLLPQTWGSCGALWEGMPLLNTGKKSNCQRCFLGATSSLGSKLKFLAYFSETG